MNNHSVFRRSSITNADLVFGEFGLNRISNDKHWMGYPNGDERNGRR
jgi:hypothetical protein